MFVLDNDQFREICNLPQLRSNFIISIFGTLCFAERPCLWRGLITMKVSNFPASFNLI